MPHAAPSSSQCNFYDILHAKVYFKCHQLGRFQLLGITCNTSYIYQLKLKVINKEHLRFHQNAQLSNQLFAGNYNPFFNCYFHLTLFFNYYFLLIYLFLHKTPLKCTFFYNFPFSLGSRNVYFKSNYDKFQHTAPFGRQVC